MPKVKVGIIGASGYTASELIRLIHNHPAISIEFLVGNSKAGQEASEIYDYLKFADLPKVQKLSEVNFSKVKAVFCCLPHGESAKVIAKLPKKLKVIDLSSDFRINDAKLYKEFYGSKLNEKFKSEVAYGLSEIYASDIKKKRIIACPGCYPTSILLPLIPLVKNKKACPGEIIIDAKTGISGAGRKVIENNLFCEINENSFAYNPTKHRHLSEIIEQLDIKLENVQFTPQVIPTSRGIISSIYITSENSAAELTKFLAKHYAKAKFIRVNESGDLPKLRNVVGTNFCEISIIDTNIKGKKLIISAIDNLTKGSSGQALQNFNLMFKQKEDAGLTNLATYP